MNKNSSSSDPSLQVGLFSPFFWWVMSYFKGQSCWKVHKVKYLLPGFHVGTSKGLSSFVMPTHKEGCKCFPLFASVPINLKTNWLQSLHFLKREGLTLWSSKTSNWFWNYHFCLSYLFDYFEVKSGHITEAVIIKVINCLFIISDQGSLNILIVQNLTE